MQIEESEMKMEKLDRNTIRVEARVNRKRETTGRYKKVKPKLLVLVIKVATKLSLNVSKGSVLKVNVQGRTFLEVGWE